MVKNMKTIILFILAFTIAACTSQQSNDAVSTSLSETDLSGTWKYLRETKTYNISTNEYLYSDFLEYTMIISDSGGGVSYQSCWRYGDSSITAVKTDEYLYLDINSDGYSQGSNGELSRTMLVDNPNSQTNELRVTETLTKLSSNVQLDSGKFVLNGAITNIEDNHVCLFKSSNSLNSNESLEIVVPFYDSTLSVRLRSTERLVPGTYQYEQSSNNIVYGFNVSSNSSIFWNQIGTNGLFPDRATISITESSVDIYSGTFSFVGIDNENYSGEFIIDPAY